MIGGNLRRTDARAADPARPDDDWDHHGDARDDDRERGDALHDPSPRRHLRLVRPVDGGWDEGWDEDRPTDWDEGWDDAEDRIERDPYDDDPERWGDRWDAPDHDDSSDDADRRASAEPSRAEGHDSRPDDRLVGTVAAAATPQMLAAVVAFAGHALVLRDIGVASFGSLILVQSIAAAVVGLSALGVPALLRSSPHLGLAEAGETGRRITRLQLPALPIAGGVAVAASVALVGIESLLTASLFAVASAATVRSGTDAALIERSGDHRSGAAAALGTSVIWLAALLGAIEAGYVEYALPVAAVVAELFRAIATWRLTVGIREALAATDERTASVGVKASAPLLPSGTQTSLVTAAGLVVVALLGDRTDLGLLAVIVIVLRLVLMLEPAVASLGSSFVRPHASRTDRAWLRAARLSDAISIPVAVGAVTAFVVGAPAIGRLVGIGSGTVAAAVGLLVLSAPATQLLQVADLALRSDGRHLLGNAVVAMRLGAVGGLGAAGWLLVERSGDASGLVALAAAWAFGEWLAVATIVVATGWRPLDLPSIATLIVIGAVGTGLFANDGSQWDPPRLALASVLALVLAATAPRTVTQLRRIDATAARHLDRPLTTA